MHTWLQNRLALLQAHTGVVVITAPMLFGASKIIAALDEPSSLVWVELERSDSDDEVSQGNKLADAVQRALGDPLFGYSMPFSYGLGVLRSNLNILGPLTFGLTGAEHSPEFAHDLMSLQSLGGQVVIAFDSSLPKGFRLPPDALIFDSNDLKIAPQEVKAMTEGDLPVAEAMQIYEASEGAIERFELLLKRKLRQGVATRPTASGGQRLAADQGIAVEPERLLPILEKRGRWIEALELAIYHIPSEVPRVIQEAGHVYHERGLHKRLWKVLSHIPEDLQKEEPVLQWRLMAAARAGKREEIRKDVEDHLQTHEAPELRATYAGTLAHPDVRFVQAEKAYKKLQTPLTSLQYGIYHEDEEESLRILHQSIDLAERSSRPYEVMRNAYFYATRLLRAGRYHDAVFWGEWALSQYKEQGLGDFQRYLLIVNDLSLAKIYTGDTEGLVDNLRTLESQLDNVNPLYARIFRSTLGDALIATKRPKEALTVYEINFELSERRFLGRSAVGLVRALIELDELDKAIQTARKAVTLTNNEHSIYSAPAKFALGAALVHDEPEAAVELFQEYLKTREGSDRQPNRAMVTLNYVKALQYLGSSDDEIQRVINYAAVGLSELAETGFRLFVGPEKKIYGIMPLAKGMASKPQAMLDIRVLGREEVWLNAQQMKLTRRQLEILLLLSLNPDGLSLDQLMNDIVAGEESKRRSIVSSISELRRSIAISSNPYKIEIPYEVDMLSFNQDIKRGKVRQALEKYQGSLFPSSDIPFIVEEREVLEESLRTQVLKSKDVEALLSLAQIHKDDLMIWEIIEEVLSPSDPRASVIHARASKIRAQWGSE